MSFVRDLRVAAHSLIRTPGLAIAVVLTLALGIGANAAIFTLVRGVLLKPLVNRDEDRLIYIRQSAPGIGDENATFSVPELQDLRASVKTVSAFGDFSPMDFTMIGLGEPRSIQGGVVGGTYFDVMGLRPVLGRLIGPQDDGPNAASVVVLTYRFWTTALHKDPSVLGKTVRLGSIGDRSATVIGVLEPCVPYPQDTEIISNIVTSPHHLSATMVTGRIHRMTELFGRLAPGVSVDQAGAGLRSAYAAMKKDHPEAYSREADFQIGTKLLRDQITSGARTVLLVLLAASGLVFIIACSNVANLILARTVRREGELAVRVALGASKGALRRMLLAESLLLCGAGAALGVLSAADGGGAGALRLALLGACARLQSGFELALGGSSSGRGRRGDSRLRPAPARFRHVFRHPEWAGLIQRQRADHRQLESSPANLRGDANCRVVCVAGRRKYIDHYVDRTAKGADGSGHATRPRYRRSTYVLWEDASAGRRFLQGSDTPC
jgi:predicted permease